jgi:hypothetical protein
MTWQAPSIIPYLLSLPVRRASRLARTLERQEHVLVQQRCSLLQVLIPLLVARVGCLLLIGVLLLAGGSLATSTPLEIRA